MTAEQKTKSAGRMTPGINGRNHHQAPRGGTGCRPATRSVDLRVVYDPAPIWMAALLATCCQAVAGDGDHAVLWNCVSGRAMYTNHSAEAEFIQPLGVRLQGGDTLAVSWMPGETAYTVEVYTHKTHYLA